MSNMIRFSTNKYWKGKYKIERETEYQLRFSGKYLTVKWGNEFREQQNLGT